jgi:hypothetical protein
MQKLGLREPKHRATAAAAAFPSATFGGPSFGGNPTLRISPGA